MRQAEQTPKQLDTNDTSVNPDSHPGWYSRGYLPHVDHANLVQMITFRLADAMPAERRAEWQQILRIEEGAKRRTVIEAYLDAGYGACHLRDPRISRVVEDALRHFDGERYRLLAWVVMPNHVHVLIDAFAGHPIRQTVHSWKSFTATQANRILERTGPFWQPDYFDRYIRDNQHLEQARWYIHQNPVKAGLVQSVEDWPYSSARWA
ncbi:MAG: transposase [Dehalococcoidia bacterium]